MIKIQSVLLCYIILISNCSMAQFIDSIIEPNPFTTRIEMFEQITHLDEDQLSENKVKTMCVRNEIVIPSHIQYSEIGRTVPKRKEVSTNLYEFNRKGQVISITHQVEITEYLGSEDELRTKKFLDDSTSLQFLYNSTNKLSEIKEYNFNVLGLKAGVKYSYNKDNQLSGIRSYTMSFGKPSYEKGYYYFYNKSNLLKRVVEFRGDTISNQYGEVNGKPFYMIEDQHLFYDQLMRLDYIEITSGFYGERRKEFGYLPEEGVNFTTTLDSSGIIIGYDSLVCQRDTCIRKTRYNNVNEVSAFVFYNDQLQRIEAKDLEGNLLYEVKLEYNKKGLRNRLSYFDQTRIAPSNSNYTPSSEIEYSYTFW